MRFADRIEIERKPSERAGEHDRKSESGEEKEKKGNRTIGRGLYHFESIQHTNGLLITTRLAKLTRKQHTICDPIVSIENGK